MPFNSCQWKKNIVILITIFSLSLLKYVPRDLQNPFHICKPPEKTLTSGDISGTGNRSGGKECKWEVLCKSAPILFCCFYLSTVSWVHCCRSSSWLIKTAINLQTKTNDSQGNADKNGNSRNFHITCFCKSLIYSHILDAMSIFILVNTRSILQFSVLLK